MEIPLHIKFLGDYPQPMAGEQRIRVETSEGIGSVKFIVSGEIEKEYSDVYRSLDCPKSSIKKSQTK